MNPIAVIFLGLIIALIIWVGRKGPQKAAAFVKRNGRKLIGLLLFLLAGLMSLRGLWEPALIPAALGWWFFSHGTMSGPLGAALKLYLDRRFPFWRQYVEPDGDPRRNGKVSASGIMTEQEAYQILGLEFGESREAISAAYRSAMKKVHPDQGGSAELAVRLNQARDFLLGRQG